MASQSQVPDSYLGFFNPTDVYGYNNQLNFIIRQAIYQIQTATPVKIISVTNNGGVESTGYVEVTPLVKQIDANFNSYSHGIIYNVPYVRIQGGVNAIIMDPVPGDIGICVFSDKDISTVKNTKKESPPASLRRFDWADAIYIGCILGQTPQNYIQFDNNNIIINTSGNVIINNALSVTVNTDVTINGNLTVSGTINANEVTAGSISLSSHTHSGVQTGGGNTGPPNP